MLIALIALAFFIRHRKRVKKLEAGITDGSEMTSRVVGGAGYASVPNNFSGRH